MSPLSELIRNELRLVVADPLPHLLGVVFPLVFIYFMLPLYGGEESLAGVRQAVPGFTIMFAFFLVGNMGYGFFREHGWGTWDRLRTSQASRTQILLGKSVVPFGLFLIQFVVVIGISSLAFGFQITLVGWTQVLLVAVGFAACLVGLALTLVGLCSSSQQLSSITNLLAPVLAALGGALVPTRLLPGWIASISPVSPAYWAMGGMAEALHGGRWDVIAVSVATLLALAAGLSTFGALLLRSDRPKVL